MWTEGQAGILRSRGQLLIFFLVSEDIKPATWGKLLSSRGPPTDFLVVFLDILWIISPPTPPDCCAATKVWEGKD